MNGARHNARIRALAELALKLANNDVARAIRLMSETTGLSLELAFEAVDEVVTAARRNEGDEE